MTGQQREQLDRGNEKPLGLQKAAESRNQRLNLSCWIEKDLVSKIFCGVSNTAKLRWEGPEIWKGWLLRVLLKMGSIHGLETYRPDLVVLGCTWESFGKH